MLQIAPAVPNAPSEPLAGQHISLLALITSLLAARRSIVRFALLAMCLVAAITLAAPRVFVSTGGVVIQGGRAPSSLSGLAAQFGVNVAAGDPTASVPFVAGLLSSPELLRRLAIDSLRFPGAEPLAVMSLYDGEVGESPSARIDRVAKKLGKDLRVADDPATGVVRVRTTARSAEIANALTARLLTLGDSALVARRRAAGMADASYAIEQQRRAERALRNAENALRGFQMANRKFSSPSLQLEQERLLREVAAQQGLASALTQSAEQARIEAERPTPVLGVVEPPSFPSAPESRGLLAKLVLAGVGGGLLGACLSLFMASIARQAKQDHQIGDAFSQVRSDTWSDMMRPWRLISTPAPQAAEAAAAAAAAEAAARSSDSRAA